MIKTLLLLISFCFCQFSLLAQNQKKIFYDSLWNLSSEKQANFYCLINLTNDIPIGKIIYLNELLQQYRGFDIIKIQ